VALRDWVIDAFNSDMPFDKFTIDQLAGDLLPDPTVDQLIATGFNRNTQINEEGGVDIEEFRIDAVIDRTNTVGVVWLGTTVGCAQCHNHKNDPSFRRSTTASWPTSTMTCTTRSRLIPPRPAPRGA